MRLLDLASGDLFVAVRGLRVDGHDFAGGAVPLAERAEAEAAVRQLGLAAF